MNKADDCGEPRLRRRRVNICPNDYNEKQTLQKLYLSLSSALWPLRYFSREQNVYCIDNYLFC